ncbi:MAG: (d)CMP kinase [Actinomycetota bacterium]|nr:(d)CMP kinase [Actinomycetota bacterium]
MIVAIDGPAGSGKSTVARALAQRLRMHYLDTGAMYRAVAHVALSRGLALGDENAVATIAERADIRFEHEGDSPLATRVLANGVDVTLAIRTPATDAAVSAVARMLRVREAMVSRQREIAAGQDIIAEGRDIGSVVFPDAAVKVYLTASEDERAGRRHLELVDRGATIAREDVHQGIAARDTADTGRTASPLTVAEDATVIDTTGMSVDDVVELIAALVEARS